ncbi:60S ribosomal protein L13a-like isoform X7 [Olea europaea var. sylvestris]|uniref:60S ribosomal protein L13a-like isoform X7 n=1 Tax=Olea europaea var. sylvestris TaxID=158386 RepID=UPI000C1D45F6|nr:60S ribosomal protein L13a-like isoform X7 [Olea europaea var. sylvestris]
MVVSCDEICFCSGLVLHKMKYLRFLRKNVNPKPSYDLICFWAPFKIIWPPCTRFEFHFYLEDSTCFSLVAESRRHVFQRWCTIQ